MSMSDDQPDVGSYSWSQTEDQVTISFLVPESCKSKDLDIVIETHHVKAGLKGQEPVLKAKLFAPINHFGSLWQLEKSATSPFSSLTASPSFSIASSYAFMSSPNHSPTHSPNSSMILPAPALAETNGASSTPMAELLHQTAALGSYSVSSSDDNSQPASPVAINTPPSLATPPHLQGEAQQSAPKYRLLTIHLEKDQEGLHWMVPISAGWKTDEMDIDVTSASHLGSWYEATGNLEKAFKYYESAAERGHTRSMTKLATMYELETGLEKDAKKAFEWYKRAADVIEQSCDFNQTFGPDAAACYSVATIYGTGSPEAGIEKDYELALTYYNRCMAITSPRINIDFNIADQHIIAKSQLRNHAPSTNDERFFCNAAFQAGLIYLYGSHAEGESVHSVTRVNANPQLALRYWKEAGILGYAQACYNIGIILANGIGVEADLHEAGKWFGRALNLDKTGKLVLPDGVKVVDWDTPKHSSSAQPTPTNTASASSSAAAANKKQRPRRKRRSKRKAQQDDSSALNWVLAFGTVAALAGVTWWYYRRTAKE